MRLRDLLLKNFCIGLQMPSGHFLRFVCRVDRVIQLSTLHYPIDDPVNNRGLEYVSDCLPHSRSMIIRYDEYAAGGPNVSHMLPPTFYTRSIWWLTRGLAINELQRLV